MKSIGKIVQVSGPVVDVEFERGELPAIRKFSSFTRTKIL